MIGLIVLSLIVFLPAIIFLFLPKFLIASIDSSTVAHLSNVIKLFTALCYIIGFILAVYIGCRILLAPALVLVKKLNPWTAIKISFKATKSNVWRFIGLYIVNTMIIVVSVIP